MIQDWDDQPLLLLAEHKSWTFFEDVVEKDYLPC